jgi:hypothetical protein
MAELSPFSSLSSILDTTTPNIGIIRAGEALSQACIAAVTSAQMTATQATLDKCSRSSGPSTSASLDVTCSTKCETAFTSIYNVWTTGACANDPGAATARKNYEVQRISKALECFKSSAGEYCLIDSDGLGVVVNAAQDNNALARNKNLLCKECSKKLIDGYLGAVQDLGAVRDDAVAKYKMAQSFIVANCPGSSSTSAGSKIGPESATFSLLGALLFFLL